MRTIAVDGAIAGAESDTEEPDRVNRGEAHSTYR